MKYYEAPNTPNFNEWVDCPSRTSLFLAGSITGAWNWQNKVTEKLSPYYNIFNPRRENYDSLIDGQERIQIKWEWQMLNHCENLLFYFSNETLAPITLFEYGKFLENTKKKIYVCIHPEYKRKNDVLIQTELSNRDILTRTYNDLDFTINKLIDVAPKD